MQQRINSKNVLDSNGNPGGGHVNGNGIAIIWQDGPLGRGESRQAPNGAFVEDVLAAAEQRLLFYQSASEGRFACAENEEALAHIGKALEALHKRTARREAAQVEGTHSGN